MDTPQILEQHKWLDQMIGEWTAEMVADCGPNGEKMTMKGYDNVRSLGGLWVLCQGGGEVPGGGNCENVMTLGYDPARNAFVGTFIAGIMTKLWAYEGQLSADGKSLELNTMGPDMSGSGSEVAYKDTITFITPDHRTLTSQCQQPDGSWVQFMTAHYHRVK